MNHVNKSTIGALSFARIVGDRLPDKALPFRQWSWAWFRWVGRLLLLHIPTRLCVLPGDLPHHDFHHRKPRFDWLHAGYARRRDIENGDSDWPPYEEVWGLDKAIDRVFRDLASLPSEASLPGSRVLMGC